jgi:hypothetical protein
MISLDDIGRATDLVGEFALGIEADADLTTQQKLEHYSGWRCGATGALPSCAGLHCWTSRGGREIHQPRGASPRLL